MTALPACLLVSLWCVLIPLEVFGSRHPEHCVDVQQEKVADPAILPMGYKIMASRICLENSPVFSGVNRSLCALDSPKCPLVNFFPQSSDLASSANSSQSLGAVLYTFLIGPE